jgi:hypothetical protein
MISSPALPHVAMNIFLVPYTPMRHLVVGLYCAGAGLLAWWGLLTFTAVLGPAWGPGSDGAIFLTLVGATVATASVVGEHALRRSPLWKRFVSAAIAGALSFFLGLFAFWFWNGILGPALLGPLVRLGIDSLGLFRAGLPPDAGGDQLRAMVDAVALDIGDASLVSLRYRLGGFLAVGFAMSIGPLAVRKGRGILYHLAAGMLAGMFAAAGWHLFNAVISSDLYWAGAAAAATWGFCFGVFAWPIPDELYAGWLRVLSFERFGRRIPIDAYDRQPKERFVGHFPRGLDLFLPGEAGVMEMHLSVAVDGEHRYFARGLSLAATTVRRFLERVNLSYDPRRPAPLETRLTSGDRIVLGHGEQSAELEFLMLPREER